MIYLHYTCHLANIGLSDAIPASDHIRRDGTMLQNICTFLQVWRVKQRIGQVYPPSMSTHSCYDYIIVLFLTQNYQTSLCLVLDVPEEIITYAMVSESLYGIITAFEDRKSHFDMRTVMTD
jgi:hypothetical protein